MIPEVKACSVTQCFYNQDKQCNANAVLVGSDRPVCETFTNSNEHTNKRNEADVGACHVTKCSYNSNMFCHACDDIEVKFESGEALCATYRPRQF